VKYYLKRYGPITASLAVLFASGVAAGYRLGQRSAVSHPSPTTVKETTEPSADQWIASTAAALGKDLELTAGQTSRVRDALAGPANRIFTDKRHASFEIHLRLLEAHDTLSRDAGLDDRQQARLKVRREQLRQHILRNFKDIIGDNPSPALSGL